MFGEVVLCFFKQKTAYDLRISDWSSDVCSSDLMGNGRGCLTLLFPPSFCGKTGDVRALLGRERASARWPALGAGLTCALGISALEPPLKQIGRASCRERVCRSV